MRQLSDAERHAGYDNQRTGVLRAVRPFAGEATAARLADYINRELYPALKATRDKVNEVFLQVRDNAPTANPLVYYFSATAGSGDPGEGWLGLDTAAQNAATLIAVSEANARLADVTPWLDLMVRAVAPVLGIVTIVDTVNPARYLRFSLSSVTDQGGYRLLGVAIIDSSHTNPFVDGRAVSVSFIAAG